MRAGVVQEGFLEEGTWAACVNARTPPGRVLPSAGQEAGTTDLSLSSELLGRVWQDRMVGMTWALLSPATLPAFLLELWALLGHPSIHLVSICYVVARAWPSCQQLQNVLAAEAKGQVREDV